MIGFIGGTGPEGRGLALRFAIAGEDVAIGSRDTERAVEAAKSVASHNPRGRVIGNSNTEIARMSELIFIVVPYSAQRVTLEGLQNDLDGKDIVNVVAPLSFEKGLAQAVRVEEGSAALESANILKNSRIAAAFHNISAHELLVPDLSLDTDVIVCCDDICLKEKIIELAERISGVRGVNGGGIVNARYVEDLTALLLNINRIYKTNSMIKITGI